MVYDAVGTKSSLPREKEEDVRGQLKLTERDKEVVSALPRWTRQPEGNELFRIGKMEADYETGGSTDLG